MACVLHMTHLEKVSHSSHSRIIQMVALSSRKGLCAPSSASIHIQRVSTLRCVSGKSYSHLSQPLRYSLLFLPLFFSFPLLSLPLFSSLPSPIIFSFSFCPLPFLPRFFWFLSSPFPFPCFFLFLFLSLLFPCFVFPIPLCSVLFSIIFFIYN